MKQNYFGSGAVDIPGEQPGCIGLIIMTIIMTVALAIAIMITSFATERVQDSDNYEYENR